jgi:vesicle coat complex subunit
MNNYKNESGDIMSDLNSLEIERQKDAVKKIISAMTIGRDLSKLFPQVVKCIATTDLELKKLVYLYIINYARVKPLEALLAVNYFKKDACDNTNPLLRALAVRTMGCLGVEQIMQFLCDPLKDNIRYKDPYVRKTAVLCVAKIYDIQPQLVEEQFGFVDTLQQLIEEEGNSMVVANTLCAINEISITKGEEILKLNWKKVKCLLTALHDNNEWCQIYLLEAISKYTPKDQEEINELIERIMPSISHSNSGVVLTSIKILVKLLDLVNSTDVIRTVCKKLAPSLATLLSDKPEIQFIALKNMNILIQKRPLIFEKDIKMFFCNFTEPIYIKMEKLEIIYKLVSMSNVDLVLNELKDYATEVDVQFVKKAVNLVGKCAIKLEKSALRCVETLVDLVKSQVPFVIQESVIALRDIFRRYPNTFESAMGIVNENLKSLTDPESKAALIWIIGEYSHRIDGPEAQLAKFMDTLRDEPHQVQMTLLTAAMKTFLKCQSEESFEILNNMFAFTSNESEDPDIREKGFIYWRLLDMDPSIASAIVLSEKPRISEESVNISGSVLDKLLDNLGTLSTIYGKLPEQFVRKCKQVNLGEEDDLDVEDATFNVVADAENEVEEKNVKKNVDENKDDLMGDPVDLLSLGDIQNINKNVSYYENSVNDSVVENNSFYQTGKMLDTDLFSSLTDSNENNTQMNIPYSVRLKYN